MGNRFNYCNESLQKILLNPALSIVKADGL